MELNKYQNILFVCTANKDRSRTAEIYFQNKYPHLKIRSAGINKYLSEKHGGVHIQKYMVDIANVIICMEHVHSDWIVAKLGKHYLNKIEILELGDTEEFMSHQLINKLKQIIY
jgi:predicted protein tyrosine phosphatase